MADLLEHRENGARPVDVTAQELAARRLRLLGALARDTAGAETREACLTLAARALAAGAAELPFLLFYVVDTGGTSARLIAQTGLPAGGIAQPTRLQLATAAWPLGPALATRRPFLVPDVQARFPGLTAGPYPEPITAAFVLPIGAGGAGGALAVAGVSPRAPLNDDTTSFYELLAAGLGHAAAAATAAEEERRPREPSSLTLAKVRQESAAKLAQANRELETFSYSVSHDLRTPLRAIDGFSRALQSEHGGNLDDRGRHYLERIRAATQRMAELIDDLLSLSRITRAPLHVDRVDLTGLSRKVLSALADRDPERRVDVAITDGLVVDADARLMTKLCENLLGNAWKFSAKQPRARIEVTSESRDGDRIFMVRDNGAGFDMDYAKKLFEPFQRLHAPSEFPGAGVGLATVQRIVARHGGRIWAQAAPDQGATFYFTLGEPS